MNIKKWLTSIRMPAPPYPELVKLVRNFDSGKKAPTLLYLGDSVAERISRNDTDKRTLSQMLVKNLRGKERLLCLSHSAYHMKVYFYLLQILKFTRHQPEILILPVNIRSFSPQWDLRPAWQFEPEITALRDYAAHPRGEIPRLGEFIDTAAQEESFDSTKVKYPLTDFDTIGQFSEMIYNKASAEEQKRFRKRQIFIYHYLHPLASDHPKLDFLCKIMDLLDSMKIGVLIYVTPINYQGGERNVGNDFTRILRTNITVLQSSISTYIEQGKARFLDLSETLSSDCFFSADETTEHLNQHGRAEIALILAKEALLTRSAMRGEPAL